MAKTQQWAHVACPIECPLISNVVVGESYGTYISLCEKVAHKRHAETCCHQSTRPPSPSPPRHRPFLHIHTCLSQSAATTPCSSSELWFRRVRYAGAALLTRNAHFNPARQTARQSDSLTVVNSFATIMIVWLLISSSRSNSTGLKQRRLRPLDTCRLVKCWVLNMFPANCSADNKFCSIYIKESPHSILLVCIARPAVAPSEQQEQPDEEYEEAEHAMICTFFCSVFRLEVFYFFSN